MNDAGSVSIPRADDAEACVIGAVLVWPRALDTVRAGGLAPGDFFLPALRHAYAAACALRDRGDAIDAVTLEREMANGGGGANGSGVAATIAELASRVPTAANVGHYARLVADASARRELMERAAGIVEAARDTGRETDDIIDAAERALLGVTLRGRRTDYRAVADLLSAALDAIEARGHPGARLPGVPSGLAGIDALTGGWQPGELVVVAARPGMGKTSFVVGCAIHAARAGAPTIMFSLEMTAAAIIERALASEGRVDSLRMRRGKLDANDWRRINAGAERLRGAALYLDEQPNATLAEIRAKARRWRAAARGAPVALIVVDYLQLVRVGHDAGRRGRNRYEEVGEVSRGLKALAKELDVPVLAACQLGRSADERTGGPRLSDLRESGDIEADADVVAFLWERPRAAPNVVTLTVEKQRNGPTGTTDLVFLRDHTRFEPASPRQGELPA